MIRAPLLQVIVSAYYTPVGRFCHSSGFGCCVPHPSHVANAAKPVSDGRRERKVVLSLLNKPAFGAAAENPGRSHGHFRRYAALFIHQFG